MPSHHAARSVPYRLSWKSVRAGHARAERRLAALRRACALGGVSLAVLAGAAQAQDAAAPTRKPRTAQSAPAAAPPWTPGAAGFAPGFAAPVDNPFGLAAAGTGSSYVTPTVADVDGDGDLDLLRGSNAGDLVYYQNTAGSGVTPVFAAGAVNPFGLISIGTFSAPTAVDADGDGDIDLFSGSNAGTLYYFQNTAGPGVTPAFAAAVPNSFGFTVGGGASAPTAADADGDGDVDLIAGISAGTFRYFQNTAGRGNTPAFAAPVAVLSDVGNFSQPAFADLDRDGDLDVLAMEGYGTWFYFQNTAGPAAAPVYAAAVTAPFGLPDPGASGSQPGVGDMDGDGDLDVFYSVGRATTVLKYTQNTDTAALTATLAGTEGWRMLASPVPTATLAAFLAPIATQGIPGADNPAGSPNVYFYAESVAGTLNTGYASPTTLANTAGAGRGYFVYVYTDDDPNTPGTQGTFPKTLTVSGARAANPAALPVSYTSTGAPADDGWNLLGNPFGQWMDWDATARTNVDAAVYVYDNAIANYRTWNGTAGNLAGGIIAPFQGFWVKANASTPSLRASASAAAAGGPFYGRTAGTETVVGLELRRADGSAVRSEAFVTLGQTGAAAGVDALDALALAPPAADYVLLATEAARPDGTPAPLAIDARPDGPVEIALRADARTAGAAAGGDLVLAWPTLDNLPAEWSVHLRDTVTGANVDMRTATEYAFTLPADGSVAPAADPLVLGASVARTSGPARFVLALGRGATAGEPAAVDLSALSAPRPNPTAGGAVLGLTLAAPASVSVGVFDALGRRVAVLAEGPLGAGAHALRLADGALAAGVYVVRAEVRAEGAAAAVLTQRLVVTR